VYLADPAAPRLLLGLSSGTSADALDLALVRVVGQGGSRTIAVLHGAERPIPAELRVRIHGAGALRAAGLAALHFELGRCFGQLAREFLEQYGVASSAIAAAGSHGQTVFHHDGAPQAGTLQLGDAAVIAAELHAPVVADFRWSDLAAGGQGAPVSPFADWIRHRHAAPRLAILNLGGIGNLTLLEGDADPRAWDTGPANAPLDGLVRRRTGAACDVDGLMALAGRVRKDLLTVLVAEPWFARPLPRSAGLERFGGPLVDRIEAFRPAVGLEDGLATLVELAAWAVAASLRGSGWQGGSVHPCGGGARNPALVAALQRHLQDLPGTQVRPYAELGADPDLREAVAFALLADAFLMGEASSWPSTTGAARPCRLGRWVPAPLP